MNTVLALILLSAPAAEAQTELPGLAVLDLQIKKGVESSAGEMLNDLILDLLGRSGRFSSVIAGSDIREMLSLEQQKQALGCDEDNCLAELGGSLGVPLMFSSSLGAFGGKYIINLKLISVEEAKVKARASSVVKDEAAILEALPAMLEQVQREGLGPAKLGDSAVTATPKETSDSRSTASQPSAKSTLRRPLFKRPIAYLGLSSILAGAVVGVALNHPERGDLSDSYDAYRTGQVYPGDTDVMDTKAFNDVLVDRQQKNIVGTVLGSLGTGMIVYALLWGR